MRRGLIVPLGAILVAIIILLGLGTWQLTRLQWKLALIEQLAARTHAEPVELAVVDRRWQAERDVEYLRTRITGRFDHQREVHLYATGAQTWGWQILTPLVLPGGDEVLVNRGFVPHALKDPRARAAGLLASEVTVTGLLRIPAAQQQNFVPDNEPARNRWYWLDPAALLQPPRRPFVLEAESVPGAALPNGGVTRLELSNSHLGYALTWYGLAAALAVMAASWLWRRRRA
jgi:surfeit locus 1 family protein